tara:strand:+ start:486 stop:632 length:147 start_codon:yes stop_codon:yes gene_type:complete
MANYNLQSVNEIESEFYLEICRLAPYLDCCKKNKYRGNRGDEIIIDFI